MKIPGDVLFDLGYLPFVPANNKPHYEYGPFEDSRCGHIVEVPIRETVIWCPICKWEEAPEPSLLKRRYTAPAMQQVWWSHYNPTTGRVESDRKRMEAFLKHKGERVSEETNIPHRFVRGERAEYKREAENAGIDLTTPLEATHDRLVKEGKRESKGKTVWQVDSGGG